MKTLFSLLVFILLSGHCFAQRTIFENKKFAIKLTGETEQSSGEYLLYDKQRKVSMDLGCEIDSVVSISVKPRLNILYTVPVYDVLTDSVYWNGTIAIVQKNDGLSVMLGNKIKHLYKRIVAQETKNNGSVFSIDDPRFYRNEKAIVIAFNKSVCNQRSYSKELDYIHNNGLADGYYSELVDCLRSILEQVSSFK